MSLFILGHFINERAIKILGIYCLTLEWWKMLGTANLIIPENSQLISLYYQVLLFIIYLCVSATRLVADAVRKNN